VFGLTLLSYLSQGSIAKSLIMACVGITLGLVGLDSINGKPRMTFDRMELVDGVGLVPMVMGVFGVAEILINIEQGLRRTVTATRIRGLLPTRKEWAQSAWPMARGSVLGFFLGLLPGGGAVIASFLSYAMEKRISKTPERFGKGAIEGVAGPEAANNAAAGGAFIPTLTLGLPPNVVVALLMGAFIVHGVQPGPLMMVQHPGLFWGIVASMYIGNIMLLVLNLPLIGLWVQVLRVPYRVLFPLILLFCLVGVYSTSNAVFDLWIMTTFGAAGYLMRKFEYDGSPLVLGYVLGPLMEVNLRKSLLTTQGDWTALVTRPTSAACLALAALVLFSAALPWVRAKRRAIPGEG
jgi:putative tricarboxylic transport membrane protein